MRENCVRAKDMGKNGVIKRERGRVESEKIVKKEEF